jgi:Holliday junction resolvasome RuvABC endonuclease subunit
MNFKIKDIEKRLGFKLLRNTYTLGIDTASTTGLAILETDNKTLKVKTSIFKLPVVKKTEELSDKFVEKLEFMLRAIRDFKKNEFGCKKATKTVLVLENSFLGCNPVTFGLLRMLCGIIFAELFDNFEKIKIIFPMSARKNIGFKSQLKRGTKREEKKKELIDFINNIFGTEETSDDICDALILALNGIKEE